MRIDAIRFRAEDKVLILQVLERKRSDRYMQQDDELTWRDATTEDLLLVAAYTRAHDSLTDQIEKLAREVSSLDAEMSRISERELNAMTGGHQ